MSLLRFSPRTAKVSALCGALAWLLSLTLSFGYSPETALIQRIVLFGVLVIVPLALSLVPHEESNNTRSKLCALILLVYPFGATGVLISFLIQPGIPSAVLAIPWFCVTLLIAILGLLRARDPELITPAEFSITAGFLYVIVGGFSLIVTRLGIQLFGFGDTLILLAVIHYHYAAFAVPILAGLTGRRLKNVGFPAQAYQFAPFGIILGIPVVAAGIVTSLPVIAFVGALMIGGGLLLLAVLVVGWIVPTVRGLSAKILLVISSVSAVVAITLACIFAYSIITNKLVLDIPQMVMTHGLINAFGFVLCGLVGWTLVQRP
jgi:hypothetical protein